MSIVINYDLLFNWQITPQKSSLLQNINFSSILSHMPFTYYDFAVIFALRLMAILRSKIKTRNYFLLFKAHNIYSYFLFIWTLFSLSSLFFLPLFVLVFTAATAVAAPPATVSVATVVFSYLFFFFFFVELTTYFSSYRTIYVNN